MTHSLSPDAYNPVAIALENVSKTYKIYHHPSDRLKQSFMRSRKHYFREHTALQPLTLTIPKGHTIGVIGTNGSGKSTLLQLITGTLTPTTGTIKVYGRVSALLELGAGFNPEFSGDENIILNGSIMGLSRDDMAERYEQIVAFSGLPSHMLKQPVSSYSSGMYVRLAFSVAISVNPDILIVDEALAVGDEGFQRKCFARIQQLQESGTTILFVSHSARTITDLCDHAILLDAGELLTEGNPSSVVGAYHHMLFAREEERPAIRAQIISSGGQQAEYRSPPSPPAPVQVQSTPHIPESRIAYPADGGEITDVTLLDASGKETSTLLKDESYILYYRLQCHRPLRQVRCSMMIKTLTGIELAGTMGYGDNGQLEQLSQDDMVDVRFPFICRLTKGDYFINVGAVEEMFGQFRFIHRIVDALHIKVEESISLRDGHIAARGFIDIGAGSDITVSRKPGVTQAEIPV